MFRVRARVKVFGMANFRNGEFQDGDIATGGRGVAVVLRREAHRVRFCEPMPYDIANRKLHPGIAQQSQNIHYAHFKLVIFMQHPSNLTKCELIWQRIGLSEIYIPRYVLMFVQSNSPTL